VPQNDPTRQLSQVVDRLVSFEPGALPVLSLYLDTRADQHGRDRFDQFLRKELQERGRSFPPSSPERAAFDKDAERIRRWLQDELQSSADGVALFACSDAGLFEAAQLDAPVGENRLVVAPEPHVFPLVQLMEQYPRYAALVADTSLARLFVFGLSTRVRVEQVESPKTNRGTMGGWSQMRYQRHIDDQYQKHAKEVVATLERVVREDRVDHVVLAGDAVILPRLRSELSQETAAKVIDTLSLDIRTPEHEVLAQTLESLRRHDARGDEESVRDLLGEFRAGGLATVGALATHAALSAGQVHELVMNADPQSLHLFDEGEALEAATDPGTPPSDDVQLRGAELAEALVKLAHQTGAQVKLIEDPRLLADVGGVGAWLRYRMDRSAGGNGIEGRTR
jgi:peptide chain release factor subunit 1